MQGHFMAFNHKWCDTLIAQLKKQVFSFNRTEKTGVFCQLWVVFANILRHKNS